MRCNECGRYINAIGQDNMSYTCDYALCEDCAGIHQYNEPKEDWTITIQNENYNLKQQLQSYKDREDKLRELIVNYLNDDYGQLDLDDIRAILDEGNE